MLELIICTVMGSCLTFKMPCTQQQCIWFGQQFIADKMREYPGYQVKRYTCSAENRERL